MKIYQFSCLEAGEVDMRQANAVLRYRPDVILFEAPNNNRTPALIYNKYKPNKKPLKEVEKYKAMLRKVAKKAPWVLSDVYLYDNIIKLWKEGHDIKLYNVDAPSELLKVSLSFGENWDPKPEHRGTHFSWWVRIYLREKIMTKNIQLILKQNKNSDLVVLDFLQKFHSKNVKFLMTNPAKKEVYKYYFGRFKDMSIKTIGGRVKVENKVLYRYWRRLADF